MCWCHHKFTAGFESSRHRINGNSRPCGAGCAGQEGYALRRRRRSGSDTRSGLVLSSRFITVDPASLTLQEFHTSTPVISFEVSIAANAPPGDYTIRCSQTPARSLSRSAPLLSIPPISWTLHNPEIRRRCEGSTCYRTVSGSDRIGHSTANQRFRR